MPPEKGVEITPQLLWFFSWVTSPLCSLIIFTLLIQWHAIKPYRTPLQLIPVKHQSKITEKIAQYIPLIFH
jgi:hypothetical protein